MKIALFYPKNFLACWYALGGYVNTLKRMGHEVMDCPLPGNRVEDVERVRAKLPSINKLNKVDVVLSAYHEYVQPWLAAVYGLEEWKKLTAPVIARFDESMDRVDLGLPQRWNDLRLYANFFSFPCIQDAKRFGGQFEPFASDPYQFNCDRPHQKKYDIAFIGSMYDLRKRYLQALAPAVDPEITFTYNQVLSQDLGGIREQESMDLLAENYRQIKIFFCLPPLSRLIVAKIWDVMACRTFVMYPKLPGEAAENMSIFEDGKHLVYYDMGYMKKNAEQISYWLQHSAGREEIAKAGYDKVHSEHTLELMLNRVLDVSSYPKVATGNVTSIAEVPA